MAQNPKVPQEFWVDYVVKKLYKTNPHLELCFDESKFVQGGSIVYVPQEGSKPTVVKNRSSYPAAAVQRGDSAVFYPLDVWTTDPTHIAWQEGMEISYSKTDSVIGMHTNTLAEAIGDEMIYNWIRGYKPAVGGGSTVEFLPTTRRFATTGATVNVNPEDGQTGTRKALTYQDLQSLQAKFNKDNVPKDGRYGMLESYMYQQLLDSLSPNQMAAFQQAADIANGVLGKLAGFTILERSSILSIKANGTFNAVGEAIGATDNLACLFWHRDSVSRSMGDKELFQRNNDPLYYGDIYSGLIKMGGRCRREDWKGIAVVVQGATS